MRRGLLVWSEESEPKSIFDVRQDRCRAAMAKAGLDALLVYTTFTRPAAVSYLAHFVPYWNQGVLIMKPSGLPDLVIAPPESDRTLTGRGALESLPCVVAYVHHGHVGAESAAVLEHRAVGQAVLLGATQIPYTEQREVGPDIPDAVGLD